MAKGSGQGAPDARKVTARDEAIGRIMRMHRLAAGLSQEDLGKEVGVTFQQVQKYEKGVNRVGATRLDDIARVLKVDPSVFYRSAGNGDVAAAPDYVQQFCADRRAHRLARAYLALAPELQAAIADLAENLATSKKLRAPS